MKELVFAKFINKAGVLSNTNHIFSACNPTIEVIEVVGGLIGNGALEIQTHLYRCLDEGRCYQIINLDQVNQIDGLGISVLENFLSRGLQIRLINVKPEIQGMLRMAKKESVFRILYEKDLTKAIAVFEKDALEKRAVLGEDVLKKRQHIRVKTSFPSEFKIQRDHAITLCRSNILNLGEGGVLAGHIVARNTDTAETVHCRGMIEEDICDLKFKLNGDSTSITAQGKCVREFMIGESLYAGIRFNDINHQQKKIVRSFVDAHT